MSQPQHLANNSDELEQKIVTEIAFKETVGKEGRVLKSKLKAQRKTIFQLERKVGHQHTGIVNLKEELSLKSTDQDYLELNLFQWEWGRVTEVVLLYCMLRRDVS